MIRYTLYRFLIFFGCLLALWLVGLRGPNEVPWAIVGAALLSMIISFFLLRPMRDDVVTKIATRQEEKAAARARRDDTDEAIEDGGTGDGEVERFR